MFSDSAQVTGVMGRKFANVVDVSAEMKIVIKHNTSIFGSVRWVNLVAKERDWKYRKVFLLSYDVHGL